MFESLFQSFEEVADPSLGHERTALLRSKLAELGLDGFLVPRADEHQNEYVPPSEERLAWLSGFTGSAGLAVVLADRAVIFVDGRYILAVWDQVDTKLFEPVALADISSETWLAKHLPQGAKLGYDPWLHTPGQIERYRRAVEAAGGELIAVDTNPIDSVWQDRPAIPLGKINLHPKKFAGETAEHKLERIAGSLGTRDALLVSDPHAVAWAFNIRGSDVAHTPLPLAYALIFNREKTADAKPRLYVDARKLDASLRDKLLELADLAEPAALEADLVALGQQKKSVAFDQATAPAKLSELVAGAGGHHEIGPDPIALMKARKNKAELKGMREAHRRDGAAMIAFLHWFSLNAPSGRLTEIDAAEALETFRRDTRKLKDVSFPSIAAAGPNAAIPHYHVTNKSNRKIGKGIFLIDSGGQYEDGTTDITRTLAVGRPTALMRDRFTRVLKGHIAIARAVFPKGTSGQQIDALARMALWQAGLDFDHGTGHGVGSYLSVHEGPQRISKVSSVALEPGMILSNEPGYYNAGHWGIRIENLVIVEPREIPDAEREMLGFETITLAPIDLALVEPKLLDAQEIAWLNAYHARVLAELSPLVAPDVARWLKQATQKLKKP
ncbi:aminopeptidase P family protein [Beijerinckia indica]|uniref:Peptidase M24 n=1 Tax=Beijerinckia indica subsp. indica (strain ATCC 9039 / DSM 1715 / NCIMB 8712) TaxID=395963 RepID=B2IGL8_BEII9|nr:aminopeptidase P family protein [Beijerinckia indica]ACB95779.1 peptidase M24 [Beijerinckia indica subsp. indica ATCC 9039]